MKVMFVVVVGYSVFQCANRKGLLRWLPSILFCQFCGRFHALCLKTQREKSKYFRDIDSSWAILSLALTYNEYKIKNKACNW